VTGVDFTNARLTMWVQLTKSPGSGETPRGADKES
jgi:hypothetical protein